MSVKVSFGGQIVTLGNFIFEIVLVSIVVVIGLSVHDLSASLIRSEAIIKLAVITENQNFSV